MPVRLTACLLLAACGTDPNVFHVGCQQVNDIDVGDGLTPSIGWSPGCRVAAVAVYEAIPVQPPGPGEDPVPTLPGQGPTDGYTSGNRVWGVTSSVVAGNLIEPSVRYGEVPDHATEQMSPTPLVVGAHYIVELESRAPDVTRNDQHWRKLFQP